MLSIWLNVQGYISKYIKVYLAPIRGSVTASIYGSLEVQAPVTSSSFFIFSVQAISAQFTKYYGDRDSDPTVLMGFVYKA